jgi:hypothetical protein
MSRPTAAHRQRQTALARALGETGFALPGTLTERHMRCGKPNCRCKHDPPTLHGPYWQWTRKLDGKTVTRWLNPEQLQRYQDWFTNAKRARDLIDQIETLSLSIAEDAEGWT